MDRLLVERGIAPSGEKARALILAGTVLVDGAPADKAGTLVAPDAPLRLREAPHPYASRGGVKLKGALDAFGLAVRGWAVLDVGASTGGFTDCLLQEGARKVYALDVGYGQLAWSLRRDSRVVVLEKTNIRHFAGEGVTDVLDMAVIDVSFISLRLVLPPVLPLLRDGATVVALVKPQFEAGREAVSRGGVVRDPEVHRQVLEELRAFCRGLSLRERGMCPSTLLGPAGNREFFLWMQK